MEINMDKTEISCRREIWNSSARREEMTDCVVPDTQPDIGRIIDVCSDVLIRGKEASAGKVSVEGVIDCTVLYIADEGESEPMRLAAEIPFSVTVDVPEATEETDIVTAIALENLEVRVLNPRKILVRAEIKASLRCFNSGTVMITTGAQRVPGLHCCCKSVTAAPVTDVREKTFVISDELVMPPAPEGYERLLCHSISLMTQDVKFVGNKLIFKGEAAISVIAQVAGGALPVCFGTTSGFSQIMEMGSGAEAECSELTLCLTGAYFEIGEGEGGKPVVSVEMHILAQAVTSMRQDLEYLADAYSTVSSYEISYEKLTMPQCMETAVVRDTFRTVLETPDAAAEVICAGAVCSAVTVGEGYVSCPVHLRAMYVDASGGIYAAEKTEELRIDTEADDFSSAEIVAGEIYAAPIAGGIDLRMPV
ncbi:MAG: DUF3794 domain-containing protein, partial [Oscillospiraceae bacterium]